MADLATFRLISPARAAGGVNVGGGALALIELIGDIDAALAAVKIAPVAVGKAALRDLAGVDRGVVMRVAEDVAVLTPHGGGGGAVVRRLMETLRRAGLHEERSAGAARCLCAPLSMPSMPGVVETVEDVTSAMLAALPRAASPAAVDILLDQPRRWKKLLDEFGVLRVSDGPVEQLMAELNSYGEQLGRLIEPATVAAWGPPNIGKSTLLNTLAKRSVSMVADVAGTTRDHVGAMLDLGGVVVRYIDTPGVMEDAAVRESAQREIDRAAQRLAEEVVAGAEVVLLCADARGGAWTAVPERGGGATAVIRVRLRADLVEEPRSPGEKGGEADATDEVLVSAKTGRGVDGLVALVRERVVSAAALADDRPWRFWGAGGRR